MLTTEETARRLGISRRRVTELLKQGILVGKKASGVWLVDEASVDVRLRTVSKRGGRPARGHGAGEVRFTLMNRGHELAEVVYDERIRGFSRIGELADASRAPIGLVGPSGTMALQPFSTWWRDRGIPRARSGLDELLRDAGVSVPEELVERNLGLSLSDQYWIRPHGSGLAWGDVNFFNVDFEDVARRTRPYAGGMRDVAAHPDNTSDGNLSKTWRIRDGKRVLEKGGNLFGQEPYNEAVATALHRRLLRDGEYVGYELALSEGGMPVSVCEDFLADDEEYVPALYVERMLPDGSASDGYRHYLACCAELGIVRPAVESALARMIVCDDVIANFDRHHRNFGIVRNVETLECRPAPIFDSGSSLWCNIGTEALARGEHSFESKQFYRSPARQMLLVEDLGFFDIGLLDGFVDEAMDILAGCEQITRRLPYVRAALEWRIERMARIAMGD